MATSDFGLSYTVTAPALWLDNESGKQGASSSIATADIVLFNKDGAASTIFIDLVLQDKHGAASTFDTTNLCDQRSILGLPLFSTLSGPGSSTLACP